VYPPLGRAPFILKFSLASGGYSDLPVFFRRSYRHRFRWAALLALAGPRLAMACPVELRGADAARWHAVALEAEQSVLAASPVCTSVVVETAAGGATLRLSTSDGRLAVRQLHEPVELVPALQALTVVGPGESGARHTEPAPAAAVVATPPPAASSAPVVDRPERDPYALRPVLGASLGFRLGADRLISPTVGASASIVNQPLELGLVMRYEAHYVNSAGENNDRPETSGLVFGAQVGAHHELPSWALRGGLSFLFAALHEDQGAKSGRAEARLGAYGGVVWPARSRLRFRGDLALELVPYNLGRSETNALGSSSLPWWGFALSFGMEYG
jgi:hypothetical protein